MRTSHIPGGHVARGQRPKSFFLTAAAVSALSANTPSTPRP